MARNTRSQRMRIVSMAPSVTSILFSIGARRDVVGVSKWCPEVAPVSRLPRVGDCWKLEIDEVMRLHPTLLVGSVPFAANTVAQLLAQPVAFLGLNPRSLSDIEANIRTVGQLVNRGAAAEKLIARMRTEFAHISRRAAASLARDTTVKLNARSRAKTTPGSGRAPALERPRVYCEAWPNPRISSPPWVAELVSIAGGEFVTPPGQRVSDDDVARANPELIVLAWTATGNRADPSQALRNPAWQNTAAVKNGRVVVIPDHLLNTPGPPVMQGARQLFRAIRAVIDGRFSGSRP